MDEQTEMPWFKMERACIDHPVFTDLHGHVFRVYVFMIAKRAWYDGQPVGGKLLNRGETFASYDFIATGCSIDRSKARRCIDRLLTLKLIRKVNDINDGVYRICTISQNKIDTQNDSKVGTKYRIKKEKGESKRASKVFQKPTVEEVSQYVSEIGAGVDAQRFIDYYESVGWTVGKKNMKDWKATVRTWRSRNGTKPAQRTSRASNDSVVDSCAIEEARAKRMAEGIVDFKRS